MAGRLYIAADGAGLRLEDRRKAREVAAILEEIERAIGRFSRRSSLVLVDAAAGKSYVGLLSAKLVLHPGSPARNRDHNRPGCKAGGRGPSCRTAAEFINPH